jgi:hypothetical protein
MSVRESIHQATQRVTAASDTAASPASAPPASAQSDTADHPIIRDALVHMDAASQRCLSAQQVSHERRMMALKAGDVDAHTRYRFERADADAKYRAEVEYIHQQALSRIHAPADAAIERAYARIRSLRPSNGR